jgi:hypothetical protein
MRHLQQPPRKSETELVVGLIQSLTPDTRKRVLAAAAQEQMLQLLATHQQKPVVELVRALQADPHWYALKDLLVGDIITVEPDAAPAMGSEPVASTQPSEDPRQMRLAIVPTDAAPAEAVATPAATPTPPTAADAPAPQPKKRGRPGKSPAPKTDIVDDVLGLLKGKPGLRSEEIQDALKRPSLLVKSALQALRRCPGCCWNCVTAENTSVTPPGRRRQQRRRGAVALRQCVVATATR